MKKKNQSSQDVTTLRENNDKSNGHSEDGSPNNYEDACYCKPLKDLWDNEEDEIWNNIDTQNYEEKLKKGCGLLMFGCVDKTVKTIACGELNHLCSECKAKLEVWEKVKEHFNKKFDEFVKKIKNKKKLILKNITNIPTDNGIKGFRNQVENIIIHYLEIDKLSIELKKEMEKKE